ncbi:MAG: hypothetical protein ACE5DM_04255 [Candidatus Nanoarchaeia archaeon]
MTNQAYELRDELSDAFIEDERSGIRDSVPCNLDHPWFHKYDPSNQKEVPVGDDPLLQHPWFYK